MTPLLACVLAAALLPQHTPDVTVSEAAARAPALDSGLRLQPLDAAWDQGWGLGDGGMATTAAPDPSLDGDVGTCTTPGGVAIDCREEGVHLRFAAGRELLFAPDGFLHLRDGSAAGPFAAGVELRLADRSRVQIRRGGSRRTPIADVDVVTADGTALRLWHRRQRVHVPGNDNWDGDRLFCLGDGGSLYRALALGPVIGLRRELGPNGDRTLPAARLVLQTAALDASLQQLLEGRARQSDPAAAAEIELLRAERERVWAVDQAPPPRTSTDPLRFLLRTGYDLTFEQQGGELALRLARHGERPFVEWQLGYGASVRTVQSGAAAPSSPNATLPPGPPALQPRLERNELVLALRPLAVLRGERR